MGVLGITSRKSQRRKIEAIKYESYEQLKHDYIDDNIGKIMVEETDHVKAVCIAKRKFRKNYFKKGQV